MKDVLLVGGGGREHAIAWKLKKSPRLRHLYIAPGNAGTAQIAQNTPIAATDVDGLLAFALKRKVDLTIVGQDDPLALGIVDAFQTKGLAIFGPTKAAAQIETSKAFAKDLMWREGIPTARGHSYTSYDDAIAEARQRFAEEPSRPIVVKASGLALGKGAYICPDLSIAKEVLDQIMMKRIHGSAGDKVVIEDFLDGPEVSIHAFCDGETFVLFPVAQDHKTIFEDNRGPNTGGMGTITPVPGFSRYSDVIEQIVNPTLKSLERSGTPFVGVLYPGLKMTPGPNVLEFNARFGDPETQVYMRYLKTDLLEIIEACVEGRLRKMDIDWYEGFAVCVVMASEGYPSPDYKKGALITGIEEAEMLPGVVVFHAGTKRIDGRLVTSGGRVLGVTATGATLKEAVHKAYDAVRKISFKGQQYRADIGDAYL